MMHEYLNHLHQWSGLGWMLVAAVWLGSAPFAKPALYQQSRGSRVWQVAAVALGLFLLFSRSGPDWLNLPLFAMTPLLAWAGFLLLLLGLGFAVWARVVLGGNWSGMATVKQDHTLIRSGPYRLARHPIYTGLLLAMAGSALQYGLLRSALALLFCGIGFWLKIQVEERFLIHHFGDAYLRYRKEVSALAPFLF